MKRPEILPDNAWQSAATLIEKFGQEQDLVDTVLSGASTIDSGLAHERGKQSAENEKGAFSHISVLTLNKARKHNGK